jgi:hypothetical protein
LEPLQVRIAWVALRRLQGACVLRLLRWWVKPLRLLLLELLGRSLLLLHRLLRLPLPPLGPLLRLLRAALGIVLAAALAATLRIIGWLCQADCPN